MIYQLNNYTLHMDEIVERIENNFINIYNKFDILDKKLNDYHMKFYKINEMIDIVISDDYTKIHKTYYPMKNYDLVQDRFFIYNEVIDIPLKTNSYIIFEHNFNSEYINIPLVINLKIDDVLEKDFNIHLKEYNKIRHIFKLDYNITKINFYLYLYNNEIYNDEKMEYLKKILFNNKKSNLIYFLLYKYMNYYRKNVDNTANDLKLKMQMATFTLKFSENNDKIDDLLEVDKNIKKDISDNSNSIKNMKNDISDKVDKNYINDNYYLKNSIYDKKYIDDNFFTKRTLNNSFASIYARIDIKDNEVLKEIENNYYNKNELNNNFNNLYNTTYLDNKFDNIYNKTEINDKNSKLNRNIVLFNTNLTNHINKYSNEKKLLIKI